MGRYDKVLSQILSGTADANIGFDELCHLLERIGFGTRTRGSHHMFFMQGIEEMINLQKDGDKAKKYQVRQVRSFFLKYGIGGKC